MSLVFRMLNHAHIKGLLSIVSIIIGIVALLHLFSHPTNYLILSDADVGLVSPNTGTKALSNVSMLAGSEIPREHSNGGDHGFASDNITHVDTDKKCTKELIERSDTNYTNVNDQEAHGCSPHGKTGKQKSFVSLDHKLGSAESVFMETDISSDVDSSSKSIDSDLLLADSFNSSWMASNPACRKRAEKAMSITQMNSVLLNTNAELKSERPRRSSPRDRELLDAKLKIENAPTERKIPEVHASVFRNYSMFKRSYELMENTLKVFVYREGGKPIFHQPHLRGIYASEGWFMKLMERNKQFVVKDPKRAHLFYFPFSLLRLRNVSGLGQIDMENHLKNYVDLIATKYRFWNQRGVDHFLVACHDWAPRITGKVFSSCTRVLCNSNVARGFKIGKDVSLPVTYIRSSENPLNDLGGNSPSNRPVLAFFAGGMHGCVRPILLQYWHNKEPDMKIFGPMPRDVDSKARYREFMKSSKYCICAKGYEVHTPRVVESIYYECVPVIISDNYVPPFFEVLNWENFAVFISEDNIPNLRNILLSIPEDRYVMMQRRVKEVQRYFLWHKAPVRYDLFHMTLHSVWFNRLFRVPG